MDGKFIVLSAILEKELCFLSGKLPFETEIQEALDNLVEE